MPRWLVLQKFVFYAAKTGKNIHRYLKGCDIIVIKKGLHASKPCARCLEKLKRLGLRRAYYSYDGTYDLKMEKINLMETDHLSSKYSKPWSEFSCSH